MAKDKKPKAKRIKKPKPNATTRGVGRPILGAKPENGRIPRHKK